MRVDTLLNVAGASSHDKKMIRSDLKFMLISYKMIMNCQ